MGDYLAMIDVSNYQPNVNWTLVKEEGVVATYLKATEGTTYLDHTYKDHLVGADAAGLRVGAYHFYHPSLDPHAQAGYFLNTAGRSPDLPHALDLEVMNGKLGSQVVADIAVWLDIVSTAQQRPAVIYVDPSFWRGLGNPTTFTQHPLWIADYGVPAPPPIGGWGPDGWSMWQWTSSSYCPGIPGGVDRSWVKPEFLRKEGGST